MPTGTSTYSLQQLADTGLLLALKKHCANCPIPVPAELRLPYTVPHDFLRSILLSKRGVHVHDSDARVHMCTDCDRELLRDAIPPCAIANGFAIGPHRDDGPTFQVTHPVHGRQTMRWNEVRTAEFSGTFAIRH